MLRAPKNSNVKSTNSFQFTMFLLILGVPYHTKDVLSNIISLKNLFITHQRSGNILLIPKVLTISNNIFFFSVTYFAFLKWHKMSYILLILCKLTPFDAFGLNHLFCQLILKLLLYVKNLFRIHSNLMKNWRI